MAQVITTILLDDNPKGVRLITIGDRPGKVFIVPRSKLSELRARPEAQEAGLYFLFGEGSKKPIVYIGQSSNVTNRLLTHDAKREEEEWNVALLFVGELDDTAIKYLESVSVDLAKRASRYEIKNFIAPRENKLSESQKIVLSGYFERIKIVMELLGYPVFDVISESIADDKVYTIKADGADAKAQLLEDGSLNVLKGSLARIRETDAFFGWSKAARKKFLEDGVLVENGDGISYRFTQDIVFSSPTAAAATVTGRPINGWTAWKDEAGNTLDQNIRK